MGPKRIYSLNLAAFVMATTDIMPQVLEDNETNTFYFVFTTCGGVSAAIRQYKLGNPKIDLRDFLRAIKQLRETMNALKNKGE